ncbi:AMP-binding domain protein [Luminiphilus syltensis NOR5-1B]|uniref:AMP-binding domain protein n=1 Tax=Luminiphilus syltensis NOR5-1B TaxID=565045 RepID=B8KVV0_9GAMM|nr:AMP-binding protein [Luminiphilus syltensis]EED36872.1 AMP-binding domain protein [Luminiphilus syltensis NOR5-1B]
MQQILDFCKGQIVHYKISAYTRFVDDCPMTVTGKIQKFVMRKQMAEGLHLTKPLMA